MDVAVPFFQAWRWLGGGDQRPEVVRGGLYPVPLMSKIR